MNPAAQYPSRIYRLVSPLYLRCVRLRNALYAKGILKSHTLSVPVISIGNLTMGGTGKTPMVVHAATLLRDEGLRVAVLSRGYRGAPRARCEVVSAREGPLLRAKVAGDEPVLLVRNLAHVLVLVSPDRRLAGETAVARFGAQVLILDDGFQHLKLKRNLDIVLIDVTRPFEMLREPVSGIARADAVVLTRTNLPHDEGGILKRLEPLKAGAKLFHAFMEPVELAAVATGAVHTLESLRGEGCLALSGIGNPAQFEATLEAAGLRVLKTVRFPDHHWYRRSELEQVLAEAQGLKASCIVMTEKDAVRLDEMKNIPGNFYFLRVRSVVRESQEFSSMLLAAAKGSR